MSRVLIRLYLCYLDCVFFVISVYFYHHAYDLEKGFGMKKIKSTIATLICSMAHIKIGRNHGKKSKERNRKKRRNLR